MNRFYVLVAERAGYVCEYCRTPQRSSNFVFEVEHIIPSAAGGKTEAGNLAISCRSCNIYKSTHLVGINENDENTGALFNPRTDLWEEHFRFDRETSRIVAFSDTGRGTMHRLRDE